MRAQCTPQQFAKLCIYYLNFKNLQRIFVVDGDILCKICGKRGIVLALRMRKGAPAYLRDLADIFVSRRIREKRRMAHCDARADRADEEGVHTEKQKNRIFYSRGLRRLHKESASGCRDVISWRLK